VQKSQTNLHSSLIGTAPSGSLQQLARECFSPHGAWKGNSMKTKVREVNPTEIGGEVPTNGAKSAIDVTMPYVVDVTIQGSADFLFHRWNNEAVRAKADGAKGSKIKKTDDVESYVYRNDKDILCIPGEYLRQSIIGAAKFKQDPRSPRKSAQDLFKAGVVAITPLASTGLKNWDYEDQRRVVIQRNAITRTRPALKAGWRVTIQLMVNLPEYISPSFLNEVIANAGRLIGVGDFRPTYGRFQVVGFKLAEL
jgi:hypothetical protein